MYVCLWGSECQHLESDRRTVSLGRIPESPTSSIVGYWRDQGGQGSSWRDHGIWGLATSKVTGLDKQLGEISLHVRLWEAIGRPGDTGASNWIDWFSRASYREHHSCVCNPLRTCVGLSIRKWSGAAESGACTPKCQQVGRLGSRDSH